MKEEGMSDKKESGSKQLFTVTIPRMYYEQLLDNTRLLSSLQSAGVDNWSGYDEALNFLERTYKEEEEK